MELDLRVKVKATNGHLARLAEEWGGVKYIAAELGISASTYGNWMNFHRRPTDRRRRSAKQKRALLKLCKLCEERLETIFPDITEEEREILCRAQQYDVTTDTVSLSESRTEYLTYELDTRGLENEEMRETIAKVLTTLSGHERTIIEMRYGLNGEPPRTYIEIAQKFSITRERVRKLEARALAKLKEPHRADRLQSLIDGTVLKKKNR